MIIPFLYSFPLLPVASSVFYSAIAANRFVTLWFVPLFFKGVNSKFYAIIR